MSNKLEQLLKKSPQNYFVDLLPVDYISRLTQSSLNGGNSGCTNNSCDTRGNSQCVNNGCFTTGNSSCTENSCVYK